MLIQRLFSATILLTIVAACIIYKGWLGATIFIIGAVFLLWQSLNEFKQMFMKIGIDLEINFLRFFSLLYIFFTILEHLYIPFTPIFYTGLYAVMIITGFLIVLKSEILKQKLITFLITLASFFYITWSLSFIIKIYFFNGLDELGRYLVLFFVLGVKSSDIGAYFTGKTCFSIFKKTHKIAPRISPKKSYEGFCGGAIFSIITCFILLTCFSKQLTFNNEVIFPIYSALVFGIIFNTLGFFGDLTESVLKRSSGMKDSANLIPGMGGVLDVLDSLILTAPIFYTMLIYFTS